MTLSGLLRSPEIGWGLVVVLFVSIGVFGWGLPKLRRLSLERELDRVEAVFAERTPALQKFAKEHRLEWMGELYGLGPDGVFVQVQLERKISTGVDHARGFTLVFRSNRRDDLTWAPIGIAIHVGRDESQEVAEALRVQLARSGYGVELVPWSAGDSQWELVPEPTE